MQAADARILDEAARWLARRHASDFSAAEHAELARWRSQSSRHEQICQCAEAVFSCTRLPSASVTARRSPLAVR